MIDIKKFTVNPFQENMFVLHDETGEGIIIDPGCESAAERAAVDEYLAAGRIKPVGIINTHCHIDHILGINYLAGKYSIPVAIHKADLPLIERSREQAVMFGLTLDEVPRADRYLEDGETFRFGNSGLQVIHLPGHSPGGIGLYHGEQQFVIVGDVLFQGSIGRTDLPGGDYHTLIRSIQNRLLVLDDQTLVYSGHGPETDIAAEKRSNPFLN